jgi:hypothetical protein
VSRTFPPFPTISTLNKGRNNFWNFRDGLKGRSYAQFLSENFGEFPKFEEFEKQTEKQNKNQKLKKPNLNFIFSVFWGPKREGCGKIFYFIFRMEGFDFTCWFMWSFIFRHLGR